MGQRLKFEATIYNEEVRAYMKSGQLHPSLYPGWAYQNIITVDAETVEEARSRISNDYPEDAGFVLMSIEPCHGFGWAGMGR